VSPPPPIDRLTTSRNVSVCIVTFPRSTTALLSSLSYVTGDDFVRQHGVRRRFFHSLVDNTPTSLYGRVDTRALPDIKIF